jgi:hypothetical protein
MGWTKSITGLDTEYATELSDIESYEKHTDMPIRCPVCRKALPKGNNHINIFGFGLKGKIHRTKDLDAEITHCVLECKCGAKLTIFND